MSLHRQRSRARMGVSRASTIPTVNTPHQDVNTTTGTPIYSPSIEESLQDWLTRSISEASHSPTILDSTCCCGQLDCDSFEKLTASVRKLEEDARLAAGKGLLVHPLFLPLSQPKARLYHHHAKMHDPFYISFICIHSSLFLSYGLGGMD